MSNAKNKTVPTTISVAEFLKDYSVDEQKAAKVLITLFEKVTKKKCVLWGKIFGFGTYHYKYESGREGDSLAMGFALRKGNIAIYANLGDDAYEKYLSKLGKYKISGSCLHIKKIDDIDLVVLEKLITLRFKDFEKLHKVT